MDYKTLNRLLSNIEKREDLLKIILKIVNLDKKIEDWFISYCHENSEAQIQSKLENDITKYVKDYKDIVRAAIKRNYLDAKSESKLMKILDTLKLLFTHNKFSESFKKNITLKMTKKDFFGVSGLENKISEIWDIMFPTLEEKNILFSSLMDRTDYYGMHAAASVYRSYNCDDNYIAMMKKLLNFHYPYVFLEFLNYYKEKGEEDKAVQIAEQALKDLDYPKDEFFEYLFSVYERRKDEDSIKRIVDFAEFKNHALKCVYTFMYHHVTDYELKRKYLLQMMNKSFSNEIDEIFYECKKMLTEEDFNEEYPHLLEMYKKNNFSNYYEFLAKLGEYKELTKYIAKNLYAKSDSMREKCLKILLSIFKKNPDEAADVYLEILLSVSRKIDSSYFCETYFKFTNIFKSKMKGDLWNSKMDEFLSLNPHLKPLLHECITYRDKYLDLE